MTDSSHTIELRFDNPTLPLVVITSATNWHEPPRMRHQVTRQMCRHYNVLFIQLPFGSAHKQSYSERIDPRLNVVFMKELPLACNKARTYSYSCGRLIHASILRTVRAAIDQAGYKKAILINFSHEVPELMTEPIFSSTVYLCNDEFIRGTGTTWKHRWCRWIAVERERMVASGADQCLGVSSYLVEKLEQWSEHVHLFLPGHEFTVPQAREVSLKDRNQRPINVCFMGYINFRLRYDWLLELVTRDDFQLTLLGPVSEQNRTLVEKIVKTMHCQVLPPKYGADLQHCLDEMDVLIMPYDTRIKSVQATSAPNKFFQYLACGKPVVISDMPHFIELPEGCVYQAHDETDFVDQVYKAFHEDSPEFIRTRLEIADHNHWDSRGQFLIDLIRSEKTSKTR